MANRRMIAKDVIRSDTFLDLPFSSQTLYMHLLTEADDDGFVNNCNSIKRLIGASDEDVKRLSDDNYIIIFDNGIIVITHWLVCNIVRKDRYHPTTHQAEFNRLDISMNNEYVLKINLGNQAETICQSNDNQAETEYKLSKDNLSKDNRTKDNSIEGNRREEKDFQKGKPSKTIDEMTDEEYNALFSSQAEHMPVKLG